MRLRNTDYVFEGNDRYDFIKNHYYWVHDFQELRMPEFFSKEEADKRSAVPGRISKLKSATLILSSYDALNDFNSFFPDHLCKVKVLRFASSLPYFSHIDFEEQKKLFDITTPFFICSNQFWQHKNHRLVLEAIKILREKGKNFQVIFTGKNYDYRNPNYFDNLQNFVRNEGLQQHVRFLGFIDREVQLCLAKNSISYIQPSLFEGWSTTVEDAKCLNQFVILSDIPVHKEQLNYNVAFFDPRNANALAEAMQIVLDKSVVTVEKNYSENIKTFAEGLLEIFS
jgi:glycosyltransferase involved in cell wall biosynthesis